MKRCVVVALVVYSTLCVPIASGQLGTTTPSTTIQEPTIAKNHFTAACKGKTTATLTLQKGYLVESAGKCKPTKITGKTLTYSLGNTCFSGGKFIIEKDLANGIFVGKDSTTYSLTCTADDSNGYIANVSTNLKTVKEPTQSPVLEKGHVTHPSILMEVFPKDPSTFTKYSEFNIKAGNVYLGQVIYLSIYNDPKTTGPAYIFPQFCAAVGEKSSSLNLWNLTDSNSKCFFEPSVLTGRFQYKHDAEMDVAFAKMEAFQFQANPTGNITFSCTVRICLTVTSGLCQRDEASSKCGATTTATSVTATAGAHRRRRDVMDQDDSPVGQGSLHHVTATLQFRDDIMSTGMASRFRYTVSCLVLPLLAVFVM